MTRYEPRVITRSDPRFVTIDWADGARTRYTAQELRQACACAACVDEVTGRRTLDVDSVPRDLVTEQVTLVGNYAISITWGDGHRTGIYDFRYLRLICPQHGATGTSPA